MSPIISLLCKNLGDRVYLLNSFQFLEIPLANYQSGTVFLPFWAKERSRHSSAMETYNKGLPNYANFFAYYSILICHKVCLLFSQFPLILKILPIILYMGQRNYHVNYPELYCKIIEFSIRIVF